MTRKTQNTKKGLKPTFQAFKFSVYADIRCGVHVWRPLLYQLSYTPKYLIAANEHLSLAGNIITQTRGFVKMFSR